MEAVLAKPPAAPEPKSGGWTAPKPRGRANAMLWLCGGALGLNLVFVVGLVALLAVNGLSTFWPGAVELYKLKDGSVLLGEFVQRAPKPREIRVKDEDESWRIQIKTGNRDFTGRDFVWVEESDILERSTPADAVVLERLEYGNFYGHIVEVKSDGKTIASGQQNAWSAFHKIHPAKVGEFHDVLAFEKRNLAEVNGEIERLRLAKKKLLLFDADSPARAHREAEIDKLTHERESDSKALTEMLFTKRKALGSDTIVLESVEGKRKEIPVYSVVRAVLPNQLEVFGALGVYFSRMAEFIFDDPRESNTEGGIFPAIFGTVLMVFLMSIAVVPLGVLAALYLREYAKQGILVRIVRIAVNNLAGVPSIVFGVFGLGFFVYTVGGSIDQMFFPEYGSTPVFKTGGILWASLTLALLTVPVVIVAAEEGFAAVPRIVREGSLALGATKFETTWRVVVPAAAPGILTGLILAIARASGEVAPLMIVGMVKLAPAMPIDTNFPFLHFERKFMHLGFHIYDVGLQSPNVDASKPLVFATSFLLIVIVTAMNLVAIGLRNRLRRKYTGSAV